MNFTKKAVMRAVAFSLVAGMAVPYNLPANVITDSSVYAVEASSADTFLSTAADMKNAEIINDGKDSFMMNGRKYSQGIRFSGDQYSNGYSTVTFDVSSVSKISFDLGHVSGAGKGGGTLQIYFDDVALKPVELSYGCIMKNYELNVSLVSKLTVRINYNNQSSYALGDVCVDEIPSAFMSSAPEYSTAEEFASNAFDLVNSSAYDFSKKKEDDEEERSFMMNGRKYYQGITFSGDQYSNGWASASINVENATSITFDLGHVSGAGKGGGILHVYYDNVEQEKIELSYGMFTDKKTYKFSGVSTIRFYMEFNNSASYAIGDIYFNTVTPEHGHITPEYKTPEKLEESAFDLNNCKNYNYTKENSFDEDYMSFNMNGRKYYHGLLFSGDQYSGGWSSASLNVENIDTITFDLGHVSGTKKNDATLTIFFDNIKVGTLPLTYGIIKNDLSLDVSKASTVRFSIEYSSSASYGIGDIRFDETPYEHSRIIPEYSTAEEFTENSFDLLNGKKYYCTKQNDFDEDYISFSMNGRKYYQGVTFSGTQYSGEWSSVSFNVENIDEMTFDLGHVTGGGISDATMYVYYDNNNNPDKPAEKIELNYRMLENNKTLDVKGVSTVRFLINYTGKGSYALGDIRFDGTAPAESAVIPEFKSGLEFAESAYDVYKGTVYKCSKETIFDTANLSFKMNGKSYDQGICFKGAQYSGEDSSASYNVENIDEVSFTLGHADDAKEGNGTLTVYLDGQPAETIKLTPSMEIKTHTVDTSAASTVLFHINYASASGYGLADFSIKASAPETQEPAVTTPAVTEAPSATEPAVTSSSDPAVTSAPVTSAPEATEPAVTSAPVTSEPAVTTAATTAVTVPETVTGDLNGDGKISTSDVRAILQYIVGSLKLNDDQAKSADIDGNGTVNSADALKLLRTVVGMTDEK